MINYADKGPGLEAYITESGHWAVNVNGVWHTSNDAVVQALIDGYTLNHAKEWVKQRIDNHAAELRNKFTAGIGYAEMASWGLKQQEATAYRLSGQAADAPLLAAEAIVRSVGIETLVVRVETNAARFMALEANIAGISGKHKDTVTAFVNFEGLLNYNWRTGWPE